MSAAGGPVASLAAHGERRLLTILFCDLVESSRLAGRLDPEDLREVLTSYQRRATEIVEAFGGMVARYQGDGVLAYFGYPAASEDDAERAVNAAFELSRRINDGSGVEEVLRVRVGVATGIVVVGDLMRSGAADNPSIVGETPNLAARLQAVAEPDTVLIAASTQRLTRGLFDYRRLELSAVKGYAAPLEAFQVLGPSEVANRFAALRSTLPLVGRDAELARLLGLWEKAKAGAGAVAFVRGEPGIGKSRLALELLQRLRTQFPIVRRLYCSPYHKDSMLYPLLTQLQRTAQIDVTDPASAKLEKLQALLIGAGETAGALTAVLADLLALPVPERQTLEALGARQKRELLFKILIEAFEQLARRRSLIVVLEDIHWIDPTSLELLEAIITRLDGLPALMVITSRPGSDPPWLERENVHTLNLGPIDRGSAAALAQRICGIADAGNSTVKGIVARADGVPLFIEELSKAALEAGVVGRPPAAGVGEAAAGPAIPASLHASLLSRLDRLGPAREIAKAAAAFGREFAFDHLAGVMTDWSASDLRAALEQLIEAELILPIGPPPWTAFSFRHVLIQDAAYSTLLRGERRALHGRIAKTLTERFPDIVAIEPEIAAAHFSKAEMFEPAVQYWLEAGIRAADRSAFAEAIQHFSEGVKISRALPQSPSRARKELDLQMALGPALMATRGYAAPESLEVFTRADELVASVGTVAEQLDVLLGLFNVHYGRAEIARSLEVARAHLVLAEKHGQGGASRAHCLLGQSYSAMGAFAEAKQHFDTALAMFARQPEAAGSWGVMASQHVVTLALSAGVHFALGELEQARAAMLAAVERARAIQHPLSIALAIVTEVLTPNPGDLQGSYRRAQEAVEFCARHGLKNFEVWARFAQGAIMTRRGDVSTGIDVMRASIAEAEDLGSRLFRPAQLATLAGAYARLGDQARALALVEEAIDIAQRTGEKQALAAIERVKGELLFAVGRGGEGEAALRAAARTARAQGTLSEQRRIEASLAKLLAKPPASRICVGQPAAAQRGWLGTLRALLGF
ncbi:MAG TPA: AAA family ATPase [Hyphomicrobiaceae bacterium]|nr:AAA family ATPase [Hyphomicrobiaceae bacterium]